MTGATIRPYDSATDEGVVSLAWKHILLDVPPLVGLHRDASSCAWAWANRYVDSAMRDVDLVIDVAVNPEGDDHVWGFLARTPVAVEALWVKPSYRRLGLARDLWLAADLGSSPLTHCRAWSPWAELVAARWRLVYAPRARYISGDAQERRREHR